MRKYLTLYQSSGLILLLLSCFLISAAPMVIEAPHILNYVQQCLPQTGVLEKTEEGFVYVKVSDEYIFEIVKLLGNDAIEPPPYFGAGRVGAHISVIDAIESKDKRLYLPLLGQPIPFKIIHFASVDINHENRRVYFLTVEAPELEQIRKANGLPSKIRNIEFHITTAVEYLEVKTAS